LTPVNRIVGLPPTPEEMNDMCGNMDRSVFWSVALAGSFTVVPPDEHAPDVTECPAVEGTHNDTELANALPAQHNDPIATAAITARRHDE
jgi:hypothetical protein